METYVCKNAGEEWCALALNFIPTQSAIYTILPGIPVNILPTLLK